MQIEIISVKRAIRENLCVPVFAQFEIETNYGNGRVGSESVAKLDENGFFYALGTRYMPSKNPKRPIPDESYIQTRWGCRPSLKFAHNDVEDLELIVQHWEEISPLFASSISHGNSTIGYRGCTYTFPDGTRKEYGEDEKTPEKEMRRPMDGFLPSNGCIYVQGFPYQQHYHLDRDFYLEKNGIWVEDDYAKEFLARSGLKSVIDLLKFIRHNPGNALERLLNNQNPR